MNERGHYGNRTFVGAEAEPSKRSPWIDLIGMGLLLGGAYFVFARPAQRWARHGIRYEGHDQKKGLKLEESELGRVRGGQRF